MDESGNNISNKVTIIVNSIDDNDGKSGGAISFGNSFLVIIGVSVIYLIYIKKHQIIRESR